MFQNLCRPVFTVNQRAIHYQEVVPGIRGGLMYFTEKKEEITEIVKGD